MNLDTSKPIKSVSYNGVDVPLDVAPVLLWTNASPTSMFSAQNISVIGSGYKGYLIEVLFSTSETKYKDVGYIKIGDKGAVGCHNDSTNSYLPTRRVIGTSASVINFGDTDYSGAAGGYNNHYAIPTRIWGVKFTL